MHSPVNKLIVKLESKLYDSRTFESGQTIYFDPSWHPEEYAMLEAVIVSLPNSITRREDYRGYQLKDLAVGDKIMIRYDVVFAYDDQPDRDTPRYKNLVFQFNEESKKFEELWLCDILQVFAAIRGDRMIMLNGFVMLDVIIERKSDYSGLIIRPGSYNNLELKNRATVRAVNSILPIRAGDVVFINPETVMQYQLNLDKFYIIKEHYILGKEEQ
jgi:hypothetical protein